MSLRDEESKTERERESEMDYIYIIYIYWMLPGFNVKYSRILIEQCQFL